MPELHRPKTQDARHVVQVGAALGAVGGEPGAAELTDPV